ncbi:hypothetical protein OIQ_03972 [Enterococcus faecium EnGen0025]|nr:hypothetical protein OIQ_03972 [Enterococcus faecium EnGen0025]
MKGSESIESEVPLFLISEVHSNQFWSDKEKIEKQYFYLLKK